MRCEDLQPLVEKLVDGACSSEEKTRVEAHLSSCEACRQQYELSRAIMEASAGAPLPEPPPAYWDLLPRKVMARIGREAEVSSARSGFWGWWAPSRLRWLGLVAAGLITVVASVELLQQAERPSSSQPGPARPPESAAEAELGREKASLRKAPSPASQKTSPRKGRPSSVARRQAPAAKGAPSSASSRLSNDKGEEKGRRGLEAGKPAAPSLVPAESAAIEDKPATRTTPLADRPARAVGLARKKEAPPPGEPEAREAVVEAPPRLDEGVRDVEEAAGVQTLPAMGLSKQSSLPATLGEAKTLSVAELEARCGALRKSLGVAPSRAELLRLRQRLALCSLHLFKLGPTDKRRRQAIEDATAFLDLAPEEEAAAQIRAELEQIQPRQP